MYYGVYHGHTKNWLEIQSICKQWFWTFFHFKRLDPQTRQCTENHVYPRFLSQSKRQCVRNVTVQKDTLSKSDCNTVCLLHVCALYTCTLYSNLCFQTCEYIAVPLSLLTTNMQDLRITWRGADDCNTLSSACIYNNNLCSQRCRIKGSLGSKDHMKRWSLPDELPPTTASLQN